MPLVNNTAPNLLQQGSVAGNQVNPPAAVNADTFVLAPGASALLTIRAFYPPGSGCNPLTAITPVVYNQAIDTPVFNFSYFQNGQPPAVPALTVTTPSLNAGTVGSPYSQTLAASGGTGMGYQWSVPSTTTSTSPDGTPSVVKFLPPGLTITPAGLISGPPTDTFNGMVTIQVVDSGGFSATRVLTLAIGPPSTGKSQTVSLVPSTTSTVPYYGTFTVTATSSANITPTLSITGSYQQFSSSGNVYSFRMTSGTGDCNVSAMWPGSNGYATAFADTSVTAVPAFTAITITGAPSAAAYGSSFTVAATSNVGVTPTITATGTCTTSSNRVTMAAAYHNTGNYLLSASVMPGTANYTEATADLTVPTAPASGNSYNGFYTGTFNGNITISANQTCTTSGGTVTGNLQSNGGIVVLTNDATVQGNVQITGTATGPGAGQSHLIYAARVIGNLQVNNDTNSITVGGASCGSTSIGGNLQIQNDTGSSQTNVTYTAVKGNIQVTNNAGAVVVQYDSSGGNTQIQNNASTVVSSYNTVTGNLQIQNNIGASSQVVGNTVTAALQCSGNTNISGSGNMAGSKQGQCVNF